MEQQDKNHWNERGTDIPFTLFAVCMPLLFSAIYYYVQTYYFKSVIFTIVWTLVFSLFWFQVGAWSWKRKVRGYFALWLIHLPSVLALMFSLATLMTRPETPEFIRQATAWGSFYLMTVDGISLPPMVYLGLVFGGYYRYLAMAPIIATVWLWSVFYMGYSRARKKEDSNGREI
ncbi:MAG: hypothetical protein Q4Q17_01315 [Tissierellia bacterium]|nr:hypothetical protein [Tissierellia bacterium]